MAVSGPSPGQKQGEKSDDERGKMPLVSSENDVISPGQLIGQRLLMFLFYLRISFQVYFWGKFCQEMICVIEDSRKDRQGYLLFRVSIQ